MAGQVHISAAGQHYGIGRRGDFYGIWLLADPTGRPIAHFELSPAGWFAAYRRLRELEEGRGAPPPRHQLRLGARTLAVALLGAGVVIGVIGLFPSYLGGASLVGADGEIWSHLFFLGTWAIAAALFAGPARHRATGALFGAGMSVLAFGFLLADTGEAIDAGGSIIGAGYGLTIASFLACTAGVALAVRAVPRREGIGRPRRSRIANGIVGGVLGLGAAITLAPAWDRFVLTVRATGKVISVTRGDVFSFTGAIIAGNVVTMVLIVVVAVVALCWLPVRNGAALLLGGTLALVGQAVSAFAQAAGPISLADVGVTRAQAESAGLVVHSGLTGAFYLFCCFVVLLCVVVAEVATAPRPANTA